MKRWSLRPLNEFCVEIEDRCGKRDLPVFSVSKNLGILPQAERFKKRIASADTSRYKVVRPGDFAFDPMLLWSGSISRHKSKTIGVVSPAYCVFRLINGLSPRFLHLYLTHPDRLPFYDSISFGTNERRRKAQFSDFAELEIPVPPITEQERIVKLMDKADELRKLRVQADCLTADLLPALFHEMFGDPVENSKGWPCVQLVGLCCSADDIKCGPFGTQLSKSEFIEKGVPLWGIKNVNALFELPTQEFLAPSTAQRLMQYSIVPYDIVMTRKGTVGNCAVYPEPFPLGIMHSDLLRLRVSREKCEPVFLAHQLHYSRDVERQLAQISGGAVMPGINVTKLKSLTVLAPSLPLQKEFAARVGEIRAMQAEQTTSRHRLDNLFQSMLHRAFNGTL